MIVVCGNNKASEISSLLALKHPTPSHFRALRGMPLIDVGERERTPRPSRRVALSNDTLRDPVRLRRSLRRCAANHHIISTLDLFGEIRTSSAGSGRAAIPGPSGERETSRLQPGLPQDPGYRPMQSDSGERRLSLIHI